jgi:hypothetical protein
MLTLGTAWAQDIAPPPRPGDNGPSLEATLKFIEAHLGDSGVINYREDYIADPKKGKMEKVEGGWEISNAASNPRTCEISFQSRFWVVGQREVKQTIRFSFGDVRKLMVMPYKDASNLNSTLTTTNVVPDVYALVVMFQGKKLHFQTGKKLADDSRFDFHFIEEDLAQRLAKAMVHAVELCGGGKEPF